MGSQHHAPAALPPGKSRYPLCRRLGGPQNRSGRVRKISPPLGFDLRTVQPVASRLPTVRSRLRLVRYISSKGPMCPGTWVGCFRYLHMQQSALLLYVRPKNWSKRRVSALVLYVLIPRNLIARDLVVCSTPCRLL